MFFFAPKKWTRITHVECILLCGSSFLNRSCLEIVRKKVQTAGQNNAGIVSWLQRSNQQSCFANRMRILKTTINYHFHCIIKIIAILHQLRQLGWMNTRLFRRSAHPKSTYYLCPKSIWRKTPIEYIWNKISYKLRFWGYELWFYFHLTWNFETFENSCLIRTAYHVISLIKSRLSKKRRGAIA